MPASQIRLLALGKFLPTVVGLLALAYLLTCLFLRLWHNRLIFSPTKVIETFPTDLGLAYEDVWLPVKTKTGKLERLHGWWLPATSPQSQVLLYLHGNGENVGANLRHAGRFHQLGFSVLLIDYRGYGMSEGDFPTEASVYQDAQVAWDYLTQQRGIAPQDIFLYGHSLGGAIAINLAKHNPNYAGLIIESTFTSMREMVDLQGKYDLLPVDWILTQRFDSIRKIQSLQKPLLVIHGTSDELIPHTMGEVLYELANTPKQLLIVPDADHNNVATVAGRNYQQAVQRFVEHVRGIGSRVRG
ncbi:MAG: alpha/beta fold hydrolase [Coleofasciculaceae cyanobacterium]